ncbi:MAG TPA: biopolymer transporter ExbD [Arachidicoccus soli]|uniref:Biopolymer transporter ExbD n=1 Tax=Arachidicoccus soli TaxID=2341117 RepID=A0A386HTQ2_9BACT|nr:biopolymer transporter ExbD [Arachidicoccus soli]AYD48800.1 biopolymer transporter ExbD [Arachidicoccus soli]HEU0228777.1 biopolymer transporter ExbD [Arachidicoccus soli]
MGRAKLPRKSTAIDMTPFCDVAFLLLTFFILTTKFKPDEKIPINTPSSVAAKVAPQKNYIMISLDKDGKAFLNSDREDVKTDAINILNKDHNLGLTDGEIHRLATMPIIGTSLQNLKAYSGLPTTALNDKLPGIPIQDTANNQLTEWMKAFVSVSQDLQGEDPENKANNLTIILKGDNLSKFPQFKNVISALTDNMILQFQMVTNPEMVPVGSELWRQAQNAAPAAKANG